MTSIVPPPPEPQPQRLERCETCYFWDGFPQQGVGYCRRHAPRGTSAAGGYAASYAGWPLTAALDWCGEWDKRLTIVQGEVRPTGS